MLALEVSGLELLENAFLRQAIEQSDATVGTLCVKISQPKAALCGLDQPAQVRMDITQATEHEDKTSTHPAAADARNPEGRSMARTDHTSEEVGHQSNVTRERFRQIEANALAKLKHLSRNLKVKQRRQP